MNKSKRETETYKGIMTVNNGCYARKCTSPLAPSATGVFLINHEGICDMAHAIRDKH